MQFYIEITFFLPPSKIFFFLHASWRYACEGLMQINFSLNEVEQMMLSRSAFKRKWWSRLCGELTILKLKVISKVLILIPSRGTYSFFIFFLLVFIFFFSIWNKFCLTRFLAVSTCICGRHTMVSLIPRFRFFNSPFNSQWQRTN